MSLDCLYPYSILQIKVSCENWKTCNKCYHRILTLNNIVIIACALISCMVTLWHWQDWDFFTLYSSVRPSENGSNHWKTMVPTAGPLYKIIYRSIKDWSMARGLKSYSILKATWYHDHLLTQSSHKRWLGPMLGRWCHECAHAVDVQRSNH